MRPLLKWAGGKCTQVEGIVSLFPEEHARKDATEAVTKIKILIGTIIAAAESMKEEDGSS